MKPKRTLQATTLNTDDLKAVSGGRGTLCGTVMHCDGCGYAWGHDANGSYGVACPSCGLGIDTAAGGGGGGGDGGGGGGGGGDCGDQFACCEALMC